MAAAWPLVLVPPLLPAAACCVLHPGQGRCCCWCARLRRADSWHICTTQQWVDWLLVTEAAASTGNSYFSKDGRQSSAGCEATGVLYACIKLLLCMRAPIASCCSGTISNNSCCPHCSQPRSPELASAAASLSPSCALPAAAAAPAAVALPSCCCCDDPAAAAAAAALVT